MKVLKTKREQLRTGKKSSVKRAHKLGKLYDIDIAIIIPSNGCYTTYRSMDRDS